jgi:hypothetical protein
MFNAAFQPMLSPGIAVPLSTSRIDVAASMVSTPRAIPRRGSSQDRAPHLLIHHWPEFPRHAAI